MLLLFLLAGWSFAAGPVAPAHAADSTEVAPFRIELLSPEPRDQPASDRTPEGWPRGQLHPEEGQGTDRKPLDHLHEGLRYNRVEGLAAALQFHRGLDRDTYLPAVQAEVAYAFAPRRGQYLLAMEQPVLPRNKVTLGVSGYRRVTTFFYGEEIVGDGENSASAFFLHRDYRDWFEASGIEAWLGIHPSPFFSARAGIVSREERSLGIASDWSLLRQTRDFRPNPEAAEGTYRAYTGQLLYDSHRGSRSRRRGVEHLHRLVWERADPALSGDFASWRTMLDSRTYIRLSPQQSLAFRALAGTGSGGAGRLEPQRRFVLGGIGTLRGHDFHALSGDHAVLANLQYEFELFAPSRGLVFLDGGTAWDDGALWDQRLGLDLGAGFRFGENGITLMAARTVNREDSGVKFLVRFQDTF